jgi:hypothetical protein
MAAVQRVPGALVLADGEPVEVAGLRIVGWNDPVAERDGFGDPAHRPADLARYEELLKGWMNRGGVADVAVMHHYAPAKLLTGRVPLVLFGHDHTARVEKEGGTVFVDAGTTGAGGTRYFTSPKHPPFTAAILHFAGTGRRDLVAVDMVSVREPTGDFTIERTSVERRLPQPGPGAATKGRENPASRPEVEHHWEFTPPLAPPATAALPPPGIRLPLHVMQDGVSRE